MKNIYFSFVISMITIAANGQGTNCSNAINLIPTNNLTYATHTSSTKEMWFKFTAGAPNVNVALKTKQFGNNAEHTHEATLYSGTCGNLSEIKKDELPFVDYAEELSIDMNASGLVPGNTYYVKIDREAHLLPCDKSNCTANNSSNPALFDLAIQDINILVPLDFGLEKPPVAYTYEQNRGQLIDLNGNYVPDIKIYNRRMNPAIYLGDDKASFVWSKIDTIVSTPDTLHRVDMALVGSNPKPQIFRTENIPTKINYFLAHTKKGVHNKESYGRIIAKEVYNKIDMQLSANDLGMKIFFTVQPGGNADNIVMKFDGATAVNVTANKGLEVITPLGILDFEAGHAYQINPGNQIVPMPWQAEFISLGGNKVKLDIRQYPQNMPLFIQIDRGHKAPVPATTDWSTYLGADGGNSDGFDVSYDATTDNNGSVYVTGESGSTNFPNISGSTIQTSFGGERDIFVNKFDKDGKLLWGSYYGGSGWDKGFGIALNSLGDVYVVGETRSTDFPTVPSGNTSLNSDIDGFIIRLKSDGSIAAFSRYLGGGTYTEIINDIAINSLDEVYVVGQTGGSGFPVQSNGNAYYQFNSTASNSYPDAFISAFDISDNLIWSSYFGGSDDDNFKRIIIDPNNNIYVSGSTSSSSPASSNTSNTPCEVPGSPTYFPDCDGSGTAYIQGYGGTFADPIIVEFNSDRELIWSTYLGGNPSQTTEKDAVIALHPSDPSTLYVAFTTPKTTNLAIVGNGYSQSFSPFTNNTVTYIVKFYNRFMSWATAFGCGGAGNHDTEDLIVDESGNVYVVGSTFCNSPSPQSTYCLPPSSGFPICPGNQLFFQDDGSGTPQFDGGTNDGYIACFNSDNNLIWSTWYGGNSQESILGVTYDKVYKRIYITGKTQSVSSFPVLDPQTGNYQQNTNAGGQNNMEGLIGRFAVNTINWPTNVSEVVKTTGNFTLYPNPANKKIIIETNSDSNTVLQIQIVSVSGQILSNKDCRETGIKSIDVSDLSSGFYFVRIITNEKSETIKLCIQ